MKLTVEKSALAKALSHVQSVVERRQTIPILANVLVEAKDNEILLKATDNEVEIAETLPAVVETAGSTTVPAHRLYEIVRKLPDGAQIAFALAENGQLALTSGRAKFALAALPADGFPTLAQEPLPIAFTLSAADLAGLIGKTSFAVSLEETRYNLNGIYFHERSGEKPALAAVATDGHRLACAQIALPDGAAGMPGIIVPRKTIAEISKLIAEADAAVAVSLSANQIRFQAGDVVLSSRLIDGTYPEYEKVIPVGNDKVLEADAAVLTGVVERVSVVSEKSRGIKMLLRPNVLHASAAAVDEGSAEDEMDVAYTADEIEIGFNFRYLLDILAQIKGGTVRLRLQDGISPVILQDTQDERALFVLMPMRV